MSLRGLISAAILAAIIGVFAQVRQHEFVSFDDRDVILNNPTLDLGFTGAGIRAAVGTGYPLNWIPLTTLSLQLDARLYGKQPAGYHSRMSPSTRSRLFCSSLLSVA